MVVKIVGDRTVEEVQHEIMREFECHMTLTQRQCHHILGAYGSSTRKRDHGPHLGYLYMEWAPYGSLHDMISRRAVE
jgi:hypothetical protein